MNVKKLTPQEETDFLTRMLEEGDPMPEPEEPDEDPSINQPCTSKTGHDWNENDYCVHCGADGRA